MDLDGKQLKQLKQALVSAFPPRDRLEMMVEEELDRDLSTITDGQPDYELTVRALIKWATSNNKLPALMVGASRSNPGNEKIRAFIGDNIQSLLIYDKRSALISWGLIENLWRHLKEFRNFEIISEAGFAILPGTVEDDRKDKASDLRGVTKLSVVAKLYILFDLLLNDYPRDAHKLPRLLTFANELRLKLEHSDPDLSSFLGTWISDTEAHCQVVVGAVNSQRDNALSARQRVNAYLMVTIEPQPDNRCLLKSALHLYECSKTEGEGDVLKGWEERSPLEEVPVDIGDDDFQKGLLCRLGAVKERLDDLVKEAERKLESFERRQRLSYRSHILTVEFFLPFQHLSEKVDRWPIQMPEGRVPVGKQHPVSVRSLDRILQSGLLNKLQLSWDKLRDILENRGVDQPTCQALQDYFFHHEDESLGVKALSFNLEDKIGLKITCALSKEQRNRVFRMMVSSGVPWAVWVRCPQPETITDLQAALDRLITWEQLMNPGTLLESVRRERLAAYGEEPDEADEERIGNLSVCLGHHLSVLYENPNRIPALLEPLME